MSGPRIPINVDVSGVNKAMDDFRAKVEQVNQAMGSGKAKINVDDAKKSLQELEALAVDFHDSLSHASDGLDAGDLSGMSETFDDAAKGAKELATALTSVGVKGAAGTTKAIDAAKALLRELERAKKLQDAMKKDGMNVPFSQALESEREFQRRVAAGGRGTRRFRDNDGLAGVVTNWRDLALNETDAMRERRQILRNVGLAPGGGGGGGGEKRSFGEFVRGSAAQAGRNVLNAATPAGVGGQIMGNAAQEAMATEGGLFSGAGMARLATGGAIGLAAFGAVKAIGAVKSKINDAEQESIGYADLSRSMSTVTADFGRLREAVRSASEGFGIAYAESAKYAKQYSKAAGVDMSPENLRGELRTAYGFSRGMGLDPSQGVDLFGTMRHNKVANNETDNKRIALMLADAIARAGVFSKADDVLQAVAGFTAQATRASFAPANIEGFMGSLSGLLGLKMAGLDPNASASVVGKIDAGIRGNKNEAFRNLILGTAQQSMPGMTAVELGSLMDQGAFGSAQTAFGENSPAQRAAAAMGDKGTLARLKKLAASGGNTMTIDRVMAGLRAMSPNAGYMKSNLVGAFGLTDTEADAFIAAYGKHGSVRGSLDQYKGVDLSKANTNAFKSMVVAAQGTNEDRRRQAKDLMAKGNLSTDENRELSAAIANPGKNDADLKSVLVRLLSTRDMVKTEGDESRENMAKIANATTELATKLIPLTNSIREGIVHLANLIPGFKDRYGNSEKAKEALSAALGSASGSDAKMARLMKEQEDIKRDPGSYTDEYKSYVAEQLATQTTTAKRFPHGETAATPMSKSKLEFLQKTRKAAELAAGYINDRGGNVQPEWLQAQWGLETGWGSSMLAGTNNLGNIKAGPNWKGARKTVNGVLEYGKTGPYRTSADFKAYGSLEESALDQAKMMASNTRRYGHAIDARSDSEYAYQLGRSGYATDPYYGDKLLASIKSIKPAETQAKARGNDAWTPPDWLLQHRDKKPEITNGLGKEIPVPRYSDNAPSRRNAIAVAKMPTEVRAAAAAPADLMPAPKEARNPTGGIDSGMKSIMFTHSITLQDKMHTPIADPLLVTHTFAPRPAGVRG